MCRACWEDCPSLQKPLAPTLGGLPDVGCVHEQSSSSFSSQGWLSVPGKHSCNTPPTGQWAEAVFRPVSPSAYRQRPAAATISPDTRADQDGPVLLWEVVIKIHTQTGGLCIHDYKFNAYSCLGKVELYIGEYGISKKLWTSRLCLDNYRTTG